MDTSDSFIPRPSAELLQTRQKPWPETISIKTGTLPEPFEELVQFICPKEYASRVVTLRASAVAKYPVAYHSGFTVHENRFYTKTTMYVTNGGHEEAVLQEYDHVRKKWANSFILLGGVVLCGIILNGTLMLIAFAYIKNQKRMKKQEGG